MIKNFLMKQLLKKQMKGVPEETQNKIFDAIEKNPKFFEEIAKEIESKVKGGKSQSEASMEVLRKRQDELRKIMMGS